MEDLANELGVKPAFNPPLCEKFISAAFIYHGSPRDFVNHLVAMERRRLGQHYIHAFP